MVSHDSQMTTKCSLLTTKWSQMTTKPKFFLMTTKFSKWFPNGSNSPLYGPKLLLNGTKLLPKGPKWLPGGLKGTVSEKMITRYVIKGCFLMTKIYIKHSKSHYFFKNWKIMTQPSDTVYPKTRPPGSQKTSPWIPKKVPMDQKNRPPGYSDQSQP